MSQTAAEMLSPINWYTIRHLVQTVNDTTFRFVYANRELYNKEYGKAHVDSVIYNIARNGYFASPGIFQNTGDSTLYYNSRKILTEFNYSDTARSLEFIDKMFRDSVEYMKEEELEAEKAAE
jgi:hypothetical protein